MSWHSDVKEGLLCSVLVFSAWEVINGVSAVKALSLFLTLFLSLFLSLAVVAVSASQTDCLSPLDSLPLPISFSLFFSSLFSTLLSLFSSSLSKRCYRDRPLSPILMRHVSSCRLETTSLSGLVDIWDLLTCLK